MRQSEVRFEWVWWVFLCILAIDRWSKMAAIRMDVAHVNTGVSFGLFAGWEWGWYAIGVALALCVVWWVLIHQVVRPHLFSVVAFCLLSAGALSNLVDRVQYGGVVDFLWFAPLGVHNNLADWYIGIGMCLIVLERVLSARK